MVCDLLLGDLESIFECTAFNPLIKKFLKGYAIDGGEKNIKIKRVCEKKRIFANFFLWHSICKV